ncbi:unnamed protein product [Trifolium pratense]|uniref:Uncharacterized protein n=1 Tax=Trifolium pratense TaxID=57577 RepID=A0ACB0LQX4_TRIPR|nr:unnamed protein product [Trifolium pratense]
MMMLMWGKRFKHGKRGVRQNIEKALDMFTISTFSFELRDSGFHKNKLKDLVVVGTSSTHNVFPPMAILYALVARGTVVLAEFSAVTGNTGAVARRLLEKLPTESESRLCFSQDRYIFHILRSDSLTFLCMANDTFGRILINWVLADWSDILASLFAILTLLYIAVKRPGGSSPVLEEPNSLRAYITSYRVIVMIITVLCILAVDFRIFPRRYAKTETYGASLMDLGVGAFVLANSLVSRQARNIASVN